MKNSIAKASFNINISGLLEFFSPFYEDEQKKNFKKKSFKKPYKTNSKTFKKRKRW